MKFNSGQHKSFFVKLNKIQPLYHSIRQCWRLESVRTLKEVHLVISNLESGVLWLLGWCYCFLKGFFTLYKKRLQ
ncbi:hypothetical protein BVRB_2g037250 [Beta vulgaris subsp. vulgaris]|nr:hypothetical protein BVRB_2g037250 [Beta vulgaris subsp. vulgaris]